MAGTSTYGIEKITTGALKAIGTAVLAAGAVVVAIADVTAADRVWVTRILAAGALGNLTAVAGAGTVTVTSDNAGDLSSVNIFVLAT